MIIPTSENIDKLISIHHPLITKILQTKEEVEDFKQSIVQNQQLVDLCKFLDFDAIIFALHRELVKSNREYPQYAEDNHLNLKIAQVKKLKSLLTQTTKGNDRNE